MTIVLDPVAFSVLGFPVRWYGLFAAASIAIAFAGVAWFATLRRPLERSRLPEVRR